MARLMSFALTVRQFRDRTKDVTRRLGWDDLRPGNRVVGAEKCMGLKRGEKVVRLGMIEIVSVRIEPLYLIDAADVGREGFPGMDPEEFVEMFCRANRCRPDAMITRIEYRYLAPWPGCALATYPTESETRKQCACRIAPEVCT